MSKVIPILLQICQVVLGSCQSAPRTVDLGYATYEGVFDPVKNVTDYIGLRYAAAPVGTSSSSNGSRCSSSDLPTASVPTVRQWKKSYKPVQRASGDKTKRQDPGTSEDCLFLNVHHPGSTAPSEKLPVIVWIHGGGYIGGSISAFHGSDLISQSKNGVVVVTIQYRLGLFGFLAGNEVKANGALNAGLLDQNFALRWVHEHISKFGGDPSKVTIWGESAGAGSVLQQVIAEDGQTSPKLFRGAITSSTFLPSQYVFNDTIPQTLYKQVVEAANCTPSQDTLSCLRKSDTAVLQAANKKVNSAVFYGTYAFVPVVDGTFIRQRPIEAFKQGKVNAEALLAYTNTNEGDIFVNQGATPLSASQYTAQLFPTLSLAKTEEAEKQYAGLGSALAQENLILGEAIFVCPTYFLLSAFKGRAFKGEFALPPALHAGDIAFYWPTLGAPITFNNADFINAFAQSFISFAVSLDLNVKVDPTSITPKWEKYDDVGKTEMVFNKTSNDLPDVHAAKSDEGLLGRCRFWESVGETTGQ